MVKSSKTTLYFVLAVAVAALVYFFYFGIKPVVNEKDNVANIAVASYTNAKGEKWQIPTGDYEFNVSSAEKSPKIVIGFINPLDVKVGDVQKMMIAVNSDVLVERAWAEVETDNSTKIVELKLAATSTVAAADILKQPYLVDANGYLVINDGKNSVADKLVKIAEAKAPIIQYRYEGEWTVEDTHTKTYHTKFTVEDSAKRSDSMTLAWSDPVCDFDSLGKLQADCIVSVGAEGFDGAGYQLNGSTVTLSGTASLAFNGGASGGITIGTSSIVIGNGAKLQQAYLFFQDTDGDTYASSTSIYANSADSWSGYVRLKDVAGKGTGTSYQVPVTASLDCNDTRAAAYPSSTGYGAGTTGWAVGFSAGDYNCNTSVGDLAGGNYTTSNVDNGILRTYYELSGSDPSCITFLHGSCGSQFDDATYPGIYRDDICTITQTSIFVNCR